MHQIFFCDSERTCCVKTSISPGLPYVCTYIYNLVPTCAGPSGM